MYMGLEKVLEDRHMVPATMMELLEAPSNLMGPSNCPLAINVVWAPLSRVHVILSY